MAEPARTAKWRELTAELEAFLKGDLSVVEVSRRVMFLRGALDEESNALFFPFVNVDDEALTFPLDQPTRALWSQRGLANVDAERESVEAFYGPGIVHAAQELLKHAKSH